MKTHGFTFWQLLLVLMVVFITAAVLFPIFAKPRCKCRQTGCMSNEKQLGLGILQYAQDNDEMMPNISDKIGSANTWRRSIFPYIKSERLYQCPGRDESEAKALGPDAFNRSYAANYSGNYNGNRWDPGKGAFAGPSSKPLNIADFSSPSTLIMLCEVNGSNAPEFNIDDTLRFGPDRSVHWAGHGGYSNYTFADRHVKNLKPNNTDYDANDLKGRRVHWNLWYRDHTQMLSGNGVAVLREAQSRYP